MKWRLVVPLFLVVITLLLCGSLFARDAKEFTLRKQPELIQVKPKKPVRIKLKRTTEGKYTWDLTGDDLDEVIKTDARLRKMLEVK